MQGPKIIITGDDRFTPKMDNLQKRMRSMGESLSNVSSAMMSRFVVPIALGIGATMKVGADIEDTFNRISVSTGLAGEALKNYKGRVLDLATSATSTFRPLLVSNTIADLINAGFSPDSALTAMPEVMKSAQAAGEDLRIVADGLISSLAQFNMDASESHHLLNSMSVVSNVTKATFADLKEGMKNAGAVGHAFNLTFDRTLAIVGRFQQGGILPAESGTAFRSLELAMTKPVGRAVEIWAEAKKKFGISPRDLNTGDLRDPVQVIEELSAAMKHEKMGSGARGYILSELFGAYSSTAVLGMINDIDNGVGVTVDKIEAAIKKQSGLLDTAAIKRSRGGKAALVKTWGELETQFARVYDKSLADRMTRVLNRFQLTFKAIGSLDKGQLDTLINLFTVIAGFTISASIIGKLLSVFSNIKNIATLLTATFGAGPAAAIVAGVTLVVAAITKLMDTIPKLQDHTPYMDQVTGETDLAVAFLQPIYDAWKQITNETQNALDKKAEYLKMTGSEARAERAMQANEEMLAAIEKAQGYKANWGRALEAAGTVVGDAMLGWSYDWKTRRQTPYDLSWASNPMTMGAAANAAAQTMTPGLATASQNVQARYNNGGQYEARVIFENAPSGMKVVEKAPPSGQFNFFTSFNRGVSMGTP